MEPLLITTFDCCFVKYYFDAVALVLSQLTNDEYDLMDILILNKAEIYDFSALNEYFSNAVQD
jgi:hypothetical protein